jgi:hypothetical protein
MTAIVYKFVGPFVRASNFVVPDAAVVTCFSLGGLFLALVLAYFGLDLGSGISG